MARAQGAVEVGVGSIIVVDIDSRMDASFLIRGAIRITRSLVRGGLHGDVGRLKDTK